MPTKKQPASGVARTPSQSNSNAKTEALETFRSDATDQALTTNQGVKISDNQNTLRAGERGPSLLEDFIMREKITHFDHERIPERIVHARGSAAHGVFKVYESQANLTKAAFLQDPAKETPVYVRFHRARLARVGRYRARRARYRRQVLHGRRQLRSGRQQHAGVLHSGRNQVPRFRPRREARAA